MTSVQTFMKTFFHNIKCLITEVRNPVQRTLPEWLYKLQQCDFMNPTLELKSGRLKLTLKIDWTDHWVLYLFVIKLTPVESCKYLYMDENFKSLVLKMAIWWPNELSRIF